MAATPPSKRAKLNGGSWEHHLGPTYYVTGLQLTDHRLRVPLDHSGEHCRCIQLQQTGDCASWTSCVLNLCPNFAAPREYLHKECSGFECCGQSVSCGPVCTADTTWHALRNPPAGATPGTIDIFFRELVHRNKKDDKQLGYLLYLQGGCCLCTSLHGHPHAPAVGQLHFAAGEAPPERRPAGGCALVGREAG